MKCDVSLLVSLHVSWHTIQPRKFLANGLAYLKRELQKRFYCLEDSLVRQGEKTERGMILATKDHASLSSQKMYYDIATLDLTGRFSS